MLSTFFLKIVLFLAALGFHDCMWAFSSCCDQARHCSGFRFCRARILGCTSSVAVAQELICLGACGVSLGRGQTGVPCSTRWTCSQGDPRAPFHKLICHPFLLGFPSTIGNYFLLTFGLPFYFYLKNHMYLYL